MRPYARRAAYAPRLAASWLAAGVVAFALPVAWIALGVDQRRGADAGLDAATLSALVVETPNPVQEGSSRRRPIVLRASWFGRPWPALDTTRASVANRNNNPLNIKFGFVTRAHVDTGRATLSAITPLDGGRFLRFRSPEAGFRAGLDLLLSDHYAELPLDDVVRRWTNNGAGASILAGTRLDAQSSVGDLGAEDLKHLLKAMATAEGYRSRTVTDEISRALIR